MTECPSNGLVFALIEYINETLDRFARGVELGATICEGPALPGEILVLFESLLVNVGEILECLVNLSEFLGDLGNNVSKKC